MQTKGSYQHGNGLQSAWNDIWLKGQKCKYITREQTHSQMTLFAILKSAFWPYVMHFAPTHLDAYKCIRILE